MDYDERRWNMFWSKVEVGNPDKCWLWTGKVDRDGYGLLWNPEPKIQRSHRYIFYKINGYLPEVVRHTCDNPTCNNPSHLLGGTQGDNNRDTISRGRHKYNPTHNAKLDIEQVISIRADNRNNAEIAREYNMSRCAIRDIKNERTWKTI
jgi:hypothetical protein